MKKHTILLVLMISIALISTAQTSKRNAAKSNLDGGNLVKAKGLIDLAITNVKTMEDAKTWLYYGQIYSQIGVTPEKAISDLDPDALNKALEAFKKASSLDDKNTLYLDLSTNVLALANTFYSKGIASFEAEAYDQAIACFDRASLANSVIDIVDTLTIYATALSAVNGGINDVAIEKYTKLVEMQYDKPIIFGELAGLYSKEGNPDKAEEILAAGREKYPSDNGILIAEINLLLGQGRYEEVVSRLKKSIELEPENASLYLALGDSYKEINNPEEAAHAYEQSLEINPDSFLALYNLGVVYYSRAFDLNMEANELPFDQVKEYKAKIEEANIYFMKGLPFFERAYKIDSEDQDVIKALRQIYTSTKQMDKLQELNDI